MPIMPCNFIIGLQARSGSSRLPGKALLDLGGKPLWRWAYDAVAGLAPVYLLIPYHDRDEAMAASVMAANVRSIAGSEQHPLDRYLNLINQIEADYLVRITSDCPLLNRFIVADMMSLVSEHKFGYLQCELDGMDCQIIRRDLILNPNFQHPEHVINICALKEANLYRAYEMHLSIDTADQYKHINRLLGR